MVGFFYRYMRGIMRDEILQFLQQISPDAYHIDDIPYILGYKGEQLQEYFTILQSLQSDGLINIKHDNYVSLIHPPIHVEEDPILIGTYKGSAKGYGFVVPDDETQEEVYIPQGESKYAMHGDIVEYKVLQDGNTRKKAEGYVLRIIERKTNRIVGIYERHTYNGFVTPHNERIGQDIFVPLTSTIEVRSGATVVVEITAWPDKDHKAEGKIIEIVGDHNTPSLDVLSVIAHFELPTDFSPEVQEEAKQISFDVTEEKNRLDLRHVPMITIDGEDARDLDDAVHAKVLENGNIQLGVHIADVSHYVPVGSAIDKEAYARGTSVYLVDRVLPMLPVELSNGICSLQAQEDRYAMSCLMEVNPQGEVVNYEITPSIIHVTRRCSYKEIYQALREDTIPDDLEPLMDMVKTLETLTYQLMGRRQRAGAITFDTPEYKVLLDETGVPQRIIKKEKTIAEGLIEQSMLLANETVATFLSEQLDTSLYRIHEAPKGTKLEKLIAVLYHAGIPFDLPEELEPKYFEELLQSVKGQDIEPVVQIMVLRTMHQAKYSSQNIGHFGLASKAYTHFTSPIRRYPDLIIHRLLRYVLQGKPKAFEMIADDVYLTEAGEHCSKREQISTAAERHTLDMKKVEYMSQYVGEAFEGHISSITHFGMFVEIEHGVDGLVPFAMMDDDHYEFDENHFVAYGKRKGKEYRLGTLVTVTLIKADREKRAIDFLIGEVQYNGSYLKELQKLSQAKKGKKKGPKKRKKQKKQGVQKGVNKKANKRK